MSMTLIDFVWQFAGFILGFVSMMTIAVSMNRTPRCHRCNETLWQVSGVRPISGDQSMPEGSKWFCNRHGPTLYYGAIDEKPELCQEEV